MTLSRWRRIATGIAAGVIVLCAALVGGSLRSDNAAVSVASDLRPSVVIPIEEDPVADQVDTEQVETGADDDASAEPSAAADDGATQEAPATEDSDSTTDDEAVDAGDSTADAGTTESDASDGEPLTEPVPVTGDAEPAESDSAPAESTSTDTADSSTEPATPTPAAPITSTDGLGTGGGVDDAECALDRLVIYAGARRGGVAGSIRAALAQAGFAAGCPTPVTVLASNCPLQFAGQLGAGSGYDPAKSFVASSASVDRATMTAIMGSVGYSGSEINILDFSFVNPDTPGEKWMAIFVPPSFTGWEDLASRAGLAPTTQSLCSASGQLAG